MRSKLESSKSRLWPPSTTDLLKRQLRLIGSVRRPSRFESPGSGVTLASALLTSAVPARTVLVVFRKLRRSMVSNCDPLITALDPVFVYQYQTLISQNHLLLRCPTQDLIETRGAGGASATGQGGSDGSRFFVSFKPDQRKGLFRA